MPLGANHWFRLLICLVFAGGGIGSQASAQPSDIIPFTFDNIDGDREGLRPLLSEDVAREISRLELAYRQLGHRAAAALIEKKEDSRIHKEFLELRRQADELQSRMLNHRILHSVSETLEREHFLRTDNALFTEEFQPSQNPYLRAFVPFTLYRPDSSLPGLLGPASAAFLTGATAFFASVGNGVGFLGGSAAFVAGVAIARVPRAFYKAYRYIKEMDPVMEQTYRQLHDLGNASQKFWKVLHTSALVPTPWNAGASFESSESYFQFESAYLQSVLEKRVTPELLNSPVFQEEAIRRIAAVTSTNPSPAKQKILKALQAAVAAKDLSVSRALEQLNGLAEVDKNLDLSSLKLDSLDHWIRSISTTVEMAPLQTMDAVSETALERLFPNGSFADVIPVLNGQMARVDVSAKEILAPQSNVPGLAIINLEVSRGNVSERVEIEFNQSHRASNVEGTEAQKQIALLREEAWVQEGRDALKGACARLVQKIDP
jgi:hypothetical protein